MRALLGRLRFRRNDKPVAFFSADFFKSSISSFPTYKLSLSSGSVLCFHNTHVVFSSVSSWMLDVHTVVDYRFSIIYGICELCVGFVERIS